MPPPHRLPVLTHHRAGNLASSVQDQEAALAAWREKSLKDNEALSRISSKIVTHKKKKEVSRRKERWLAEQVVLDRESIECQLELEKALVSCSKYFSDDLLKESSSQENRFALLLESLKKQHALLRSSLLSVRQQQEEGKISREVVETIRAKFLTLREDFLESKEIVDGEGEDIVSALDTSEDDSSRDKLDCAILETMDAFSRTCSTRCVKLPTALEQTYRCALQEEGDQALSHVLTLQENKPTNDFPESDLRTVSLIVKTCDSTWFDEDKKASAITTDIYDRILNCLPHLKIQSARVAVDLVLRQKRDKAHMRSIIRQYKKRVFELLKSFEDAITAHEQMSEMQSSIEEDLRLQVERKKKSDEILESLRAVRDAKRDAQLAEEQMRRTEEEQKKEKVSRIREAEFQQRLEKLKEYRIQQRALEEKERAVQSAIAEEKALQRALQHEHDLKRVEERRKEYEEKCRLRESAQRAIEEIKETRAKVLEDFFKGVEKRLGVSRDAERVLRGTASQKGDPFVSLTEAARYNVHGYTVDEIMKDPRFRLQLALVDAGLHQTPYGREVITKGFHVPVALRTSEDNPLRIEY